MRRGSFRMIAHSTGVQRAARMHRIAPESLIADLDAAIARAEDVNSGTA
jgi:hypothetical protein